MSKIEYSSESRVWYIASVILLGVTTLCYSIVHVFVLPDQSQIFPLVSKAITVSFVFLGLSGLFVGFQGFRFKEGKSVLVKADGEQLILKLEKVLLDNEHEVRETECVSAPDLGLWRDVGRLLLEDGEIEIKELWFYMYFYRTQVAIRNKVPEEIVEKIIADLE